MIVAPSTPEQTIAVTPAPSAPPANAEPTAAPDSVGSPRRRPIMLHMPVSVRNVSLVLLAGFASLFVLQAAKAVFIPFMLGLIFSYALSPLVNRAESWHVPRWLGAAVLLIAILGALGGTAYALGDQAVKMVESLPAAAQKFERTIKLRGNTSNNTLETVQKAATKIEQVAKEGNPTASNPGAMRVVIEKSRFNIRDYLWSGTLGLIELIGQFTAVVFLTYFLVVSGNTFRRKLIKLAGPRLTSKKITLQALDEITGQIQLYLQVQLLISVLVGVLTGLALWALGLENAAVWGIAAGVLNLVPYVGSVITAVAAALVGFLQFGSINMALAVGGTSLVIHTIVGNLLTPWLTSRTSRMNPVAVFVGLLAWGWLWGVWGLLLGIPILMIIKSICDRVDELEPISELLGS